jgi:glutaredoxin
MKFFARIFLPFLLLAYIATETYLKLNKSSLCEATGCKLAGELLRFDAIYLNYAGIVAIFFLIIFGYGSLKSKFFEVLFFIGIYAGIAFEATILSYQFIVNPEPCIFCLGIFGSLLLIAFFASIKHFIYVLFSIAMIFVGLNALSIAKNKSYITKNGIYLIQSKGCSHCKKVKAYFTKNEVEYNAISVSEVNARNFLKFLNISSIPVLIQKSASDIKIIKGDQAIIAYFESQKPRKEENKVEKLEVKEAIVTQSPTTGFSNDLPNFLAGGEDEGCAITITEAPSCEDNETD